MLTTKPYAVAPGVRTNGNQTWSCVRPTGVAQQAREQKLSNDNGKDALIQWPNP